MPFEDLRSYIAELEKQGELQRVKAEVDWDLEMGAITRRVLDTRAPAPLFETIKDYPRGYQVFGCMFGPTKPVIQGRMAIAFGFPKETPPQDLITWYAERIEHPIKPQKVTKEGAPCKEHFQAEGKVNLLQFPVPLVHGMDKGRYIGTWCICITRDPDTDWVNWGVYRCMIHDEKTLGILLHPVQQHGGNMYFHKNEQRGKPMPIAIVIGADPISQIAAASEFPYGVSEVDMAGALRGAPVKLVPCETIDLEVPATAEIVIEGVIPPGERRMEGPFGEYTGYAVHSAPAPVVNVNCITHRSNPILTLANMGKPWDDASVCDSINRSALVYKQLRDIGIPVKGVYTFAPQLSLAVSVPSAPGVALRIASALWTGSSRTDLPYVIVVNDDVDVCNLEDVWWCVTTRLHPKNGVHIVTNKVANPLIPWLTPEERETRITSGVLFDATFPSYWTKEYLQKHCMVVDFERGWPKESTEKVLSRWSEYGYNK